MTREFEPLPLPGQGGSVAEDIAAWIDSPAMKALLDEFDLARPKAGPLADRLAELGEISKRWDYRGGKERWEARREEFPDDRLQLIHAASASLGLLGRQTPASDVYDHVLVLGAGVGPMMQRARLAAETLRAGVRAATVSGLGSLRPLGHQIPSLPVCPTEDDAVVLALSRAFGLDEPADCRELTTGAGLQRYRIRSYPAASPPVYALAAATGPDGRRPTTRDGFAIWSESVPGDPRMLRLLVVTTDLFVPFQHCAAVRMLTLPFGCTVDTIGFDRARSPYERAPQATELLQEVRSALVWMHEIVLAGDSADARP